MSAFKFTEYNDFFSNGFHHAMVYFTAKNPESQQFSPCWIKYRSGNKPKTLTELESRVGCEILTVE